MREFSSSSEGMFKPADSFESADSLSENQPPKPFMQGHISPSDKRKQDEVEQQEKTDAENELDEKMAFFESISGVSVA